MSNNKRTKPKEKVPSKKESQISNDDEGKADDGGVQLAIGSVIDSLLYLGSLAGVDPTTLDKWQENFTAQGELVGILKEMENQLTKMYDSQETKLEKMNDIIGSKVNIFKMADVLDITIQEEQFGLMETFNLDRQKMDKNYDTWDKNYNDQGVRLNETDTQIKILETRTNSFPLANQMSKADKQEVVLLSHETVQAKVAELQQEWNALNDKVGGIIQQSLNWEFKPDVVLYLCLNCGLYLQHDQESLFNYADDDIMAFKKLAKSPVQTKNRYEAIKSKREQEEKKKSKGKV